MRIQSPARIAIAFLAVSHGFAQELVISGVIRDSVTGSPIPGVELALDSVTATLHWQSPGKTDQAGAFRFEKLLAGSYQLRMTKRGYVGSNYAEGRIERIKVDTGKGAEDLSPTLTPTATLKGRVFDALDQPLAGVSLYAERDGAYPATSEKDGSYRIEDLPPGDYRISIRVPYSIRKKTVKKDPESGAIEGYPNTQYYPGVEEAVAASTVLLTGGSRIDFDIRLRPVPLVEVSGNVLDAATRQPLATGAIEITPVTGGLTDETYERRPLEGDDAHFRFDLLRPGRYAVLVYRDRAKGASPYTQMIDVRSGGLSDLRMTTPVFGSIAGRLVMPETTNEMGPFTIRFVLPYAPAREVTTKPNTPFLLENMPPGPWSVAVTWTNFGRGFEALYVAAIRQGGVTQAGFSGPVTVSEGPSVPFEIEMSDHFGGLSGSVAAENRPVADAIVIIKGSGRQYRAVTDAEGAFVLKVPPGDYSLSAWSGKYLTDARVLQRLPAVAAMSNAPREAGLDCGGRTASASVRDKESSFIRLELCKP